LNSKALVYLVSYILWVTILQLKIGFNEKLLLSASVYD
jgi:hypothetical protein